MKSRVKLCKQAAEGKMFKLLLFKVDIKTFPSWYCWFPSCVSEVPLRSFFPIAALPMGDCGFSRREPPILQSRPFVSGSLGFYPHLYASFFLAIAILKVILTIALSCKLIQRRWPPPCLGAWILYPRILLLPHAKVMLLAP